LPYFLAANHATSLGDQVALAAEVAELHIAEDAILPAGWQMKRIEINADVTPGLAIVEFIHAFDMVRPAFVVGSQYSSICIAMQHVLGTVGVPQISPTASSNRLSNQENAPSFLRVAPSDHVIVDGLVSFLLHYNWLHIGTLSSLDEYGEGGALSLFRKCVARYLTRKSVNVVRKSLCSC
jgi:ABC-type branched-subunit amino acid transport system substrate-binding protein